MHHAKHGFRPRKRALLIALVTVVAILGIIIGVAFTSHSTAHEFSKSEAPPGQRPAVTPATSSAASYTYEDGYDAASRVSAAQIYSAYPNGDTASAGWFWCSEDDPTPGASQAEGMGSANGIGDVPGTPWYDGCMADMKARDIP